MRAAIIESRPEIHNELKAILRELHIDVVMWSDKGSGWSQEFQVARPDIVFIDFLVSGRDGLRCLEMAIEMGNAPFFIFMHSFRGLRANELEERAFSLGADVVIQKPIAPERLRAAISRYLRQREENSLRKVKLVLRE